MRARTYSVPSRLIGHQVEARLYPDTLEIWYRDTRVETYPRLRGERAYRIDYRHVIDSLVRKPGAFANYRYREELFPTLVFRRAYDALRETHGDRADVEYVQILKLAADTMESSVERSLATLLDGRQSFDYAAVETAVRPREPEVPALSLPTPDLGAYDELLGGAA